MLDTKLGDKFRKIPLSRFLRYLQFHGVAPSSVTDAHAQGFLEALEHESLCRNPRTAHQNTCRAWNRACDEIDGWPQVRLNVPVYRQRIGFPWSAFPQSFRVDVDGFFATQSGENFLSDGPPKPLAPRTIETQRDLIRCAASALVRAGMPIEDITDLSFLCRPENVRTLLEREYERRGRKATKYMAQMAYVLRTVALYHADLPEQQRAEVVKLYRQVAARAEPASGKDQVLLRWFDDSGNVARFMAFPTQEMQVVLARKSINRPEALRFQTALMIELWTFTMLRLENFRTLRMDEHMIRRDKSMIIHIPAHQVKNREEFETELPAIVVEHLEVYREKVRPVLYSGPSPFLFPGRQGDAKSAGTVRKQVSTAMFELTGLPFHPHCFRKIGPKIYLDRRPGEYDVVRRKLGHKSTRYTFSTYTGSETRAVHRHFDEVLLDLHPDTKNHDRGSVA